ncbi:MAG: sugar transferase, partial [Candidatus Promineifilaceae bacterium]
MLRRFSVNYAVFSILLDGVLTLMALLIAIALRPSFPQVPLLVPVQEVHLPEWVYVLIPLIWVGTFLFASVYDPKGTYRLVDELQTVSLASVLATLICAGVFYLILREFSRYLFLSFVALNIFLLIGWRLVARIAWRLLRFPAAAQSVLIIGAGDLGRRIGQMVKEYSWTGLTLVGYLDDAPAASARTDVKWLGAVDDARRVVEQFEISDVVVALPRSAFGRVNDLVLNLRDLPVRMRVVPDYYSLALYQATVEDFAGVPMINLRDPALNDVQRLAKRAFDLLIGGIASLVILPLLGIVAIAIKIDNPGPIIFRQKRVGENGRLFEMYKFRSMIVGAEDLQDEVTEQDPDGKILYKKADDPRITRVGRIIRRTSLDELPQLFNVLKGDMSLVGPRPELPFMIGHYEPWQLKRFAVPQGMTGWWQINGRADKPLHLHT